MLSNQIKIKSLFESGKSPYRHTHAYTKHNIQ